MQGYLADHDWFVDTVFLDDDLDQERDALYDLMKETSSWRPNAPTPAFAAVKPPAAA